MVRLIIRAALSVETRGRALMAAQLRQLIPHKAYLPRVPRKVLLSIRRGPAGRRQAVSVQQRMPAAMAARQPIRGLARQVAVGPAVQEEPAARVAMMSRTEILALVQEGALMAGVMPGPIIQPRLMQAWLVAHRSALVIRLERLAAAVGRRKPPERREPTVQAAAAAILDRLA